MARADDPRARMREHAIVRRDREPFLPVHYGTKSMKTFCGLDGKDCRLVTLDQRIVTCRKCQEHQGWAAAKAGPIRS